MKNKTLVFISMIFLILIVPYILFMTFSDSVRTKTEELSKPEIEEPKLFEATNIVYSNIANLALPEKVIGLRSNTNTKGKGFVFEKDDKFYIYLVYSYSTVTEKPGISTERDGNNLVITTDLPYIDPNAIGLTAMSYHNFEIEVEGDFDKVILNEIIKTVE